MIYIAAEHLEYPVNNSCVNKFRAEQTETFEVDNKVVTINVNAHYYFASVLQFQLDCATSGRSEVDIPLQKQFDVGFPFVEVKIDRYLQSLAYARKNRVDHLRKVHLVVFRQQSESKVKFSGTYGIHNRLNQIRLILVEFFCFIRKIELMIGRYFAYLNRIVICTRFKQQVESAVVAVFISIIISLIFVLFFISSILIDDFLSVCVVRRKLIAVFIVIEYANTVFLHAVCIFFVIYHYRYEIACKIKRETVFSSHGYSKVDFHEFQRFIERFVDKTGIYLLNYRQYRSHRYNRRDSVSAYSEYDSGKFLLQRRSGIICSRSNSAVGSGSRRQSYKVAEIEVEYQISAFNVHSRKQFRNNVVYKRVNYFGESQIEFEFGQSDVCNLESGQIDIYAVSISIDTQQHHTGRELDSFLALTYYNSFFRFKFKYKRAVRRIFSV